MSAVSRVPDFLDEEPHEIEVVTAADLLALPDPPDEDQLLGPLLVRGARTVIGAATGHGKSTAGLQMLRAVIAGDAFLDWTGPGDGRVLVLDAEQGLRSIKRRLAAANLGAHAELMDYIRVPDGLELDRNLEEQKRLEEILELGEYLAVMLDPLYKLHRGDSNDERAAVDLMRKLDEWRERYHFGLILPMHLRKAPPQGEPVTLDSLYGSGANTRGAEIVLGMKRINPGFSKMYLLKDRDGDLPVGEDWFLLFDQDTQTFKRDPNQGKPGLQELVNELLAEEPTLTQKQAAARLGVTDRTVRKYWPEGQRDAQIALGEDVVPDDDIPF